MARHRRRSSHRRGGIGSWRRSGIRALSALAATAVLGATGIGWYTEHQLTTGMTLSRALGGDAPKSVDGATNILLIGLDSRKDQLGNDLPKAILNQLHAGDGSEGGYNTNTLILIHIPAGGGRATAFSIPRDDYVAVTGIPGYSHIKIKEAYGLTKANEQAKLMDEGVTDQATLETKSREAGRAATLRAVRNLTGVPIDHFAEVNLAGFYDLASSLGGVQVCLNHPVQDDYSGANFPAGVQRLNASQALAFVRQRHGLDNGDLDRTHRQQAFLVSVAHQLQNAGTLSDFGKIQSLVDVIKRDVVIDSGWDIVHFAREMSSMTGSNVEFRTLPILGFAQRNDQDVNLIDPDAIRTEVRQAFGYNPAAKLATKPASVADVVNANAGNGVARKMQAALGTLGFGKGVARNASASDPSESTVLYGPGAQADATELGDRLYGLPVKADPSLPAGKITLVVGPDFDAEGFLDSFSTAGSTTTTSAPTTTAAPATDAAAAQTSAPNGQPVVGDGLPCVN